MRLQIHTTFAAVVVVTVDHELFHFQIAHGSSRSLLLQFGSQSDAIFARGAVC